nr:reverse transcriptase domain-containing protein [Pectobacterium punjabense]
MSINDAQGQNIAAISQGCGQNPRAQRSGAEIDTAVSGRTKAEVPLTIETVTERANMMLAYQRVVENKGAAGVDNLSVSALKPWLKENWASIKSALMTGHYPPRAIRKMDIPKPDGGVRTLGIPTVADRLIQQAIAQKLSAIVDPTFSNSSYGFRPARNAWQAVRQAQTGSLKSGRQ